MEKVKEFVKTHQKEIAIGAALYLSYCIGYRRGWNKYNRIIMKALHEIDEKGYRLIKVTSEVM